MAAATNDDVLLVREELGIEFDDLSFDDDSQYYSYIVERWERVDILINEMISSDNHDETLYPEQHTAHVYWTCAEVVRRRRVQLLVAEDGGGGGFTLGKYKVDSSAGATMEHNRLHDLYLDMAMKILDAFVPVEAFRFIGSAIFIKSASSRAPWASQVNRG